MGVDEIEIVHQEREDGEEPRRRPTALLVLAALVVVAVLAAVVISATGDDGDVEVAIDEDDGEPSEPAPDGRGMPAPIALGGPTDGKDSVGLPVQVEPATDLVDGQTVTVTATGFPPGESVGVVMCAREAGRDHGGRGAEACNLGHFAQATSDTDGVVVIEFRVRRLVLLDGTEVDCASEPDRCLVGVGLISDYDQSGGAMVSFDPDVPLPPAPTASLSRSAGLADGEEVELRVTGLLPDSAPGAEVCDIARQRCASPGWVLPPADSSGTLTATVPLWRTLGAYGMHHGAGSGNLDCAATPCLLHVYGETSGGRAVPPVQFGSDPGSPAPRPPTATLLERGPFGPGATIRVAVTGLAPDVQVDATICSPGGGECFGGGAAAGEGGEARIELPVAPELHRAGGGCDPCQVVFSVYHLADPGGLRPPLNPDPIDVTIAG